MKSNAFKARLLGSVLLAISALPSSLAASGSEQRSELNITGSESSTNSTEDVIQDTWNAFREQFPYLIQAIAAHKTSTGYVVIVSEPPPHVTRDDFLELLPDAEFKRHTIGADGWVTDVIAHVTLSKPELDELVLSLHRLLFDTTYGAHLVEITGKRPQLYESLSFEFYPGELDSWVRGDTPLKFEPLTGGTTTSASEIRSPFSDVYHSMPPGLVGWWIPSGTDLQHCRAQIRQFAVDSDLFIGAIENEHGVLMLARERRIELEALPPLRAETIQLLAQTETDELMQTINPQAISCYITDDTWERWEINLLSPELYDTEFGTLLTVADVLLKSWSLNGLNSVRGFRKYPTPSTWPFKQLLTKSINSDGLVFNFDSESAGHALLKNGMSTYSISRTGVLPLAYLPSDMLGIDISDEDEQLLEAENRGYQWFNAQSDPHLVRVVQYTALLQAFAEFQIAPTDRGSATLESDLANQAIDSEIKRLIELVRDMDVTEIESLNDQLVRTPEFRAAAGAMRSAGIDVLTGAEYLTEMKKASYEGLLTIHGWDADATQTSVLRLSSPLYLLPDEFEEFEEADSEDALLTLLERIAPIEKAAQALKLLASRDRSDAKIGDILSSQSTGWTHSPVLIYDQNIGENEWMTGGHNLRVIVEQVRPSVSTPKGKIQQGINPGEWLVHPDDLSRVVFRGRERAPVLRESSTNIKSLVEKFGPHKRGITRRFGFQDNMSPLSVEEMDWFIKTQSKNPNCVAVLRRHDGSFVVDNGRKAFAANTHVECVDLLVDVTGSLRKLDIEIAGMDRVEAASFGSNLMLRKNGRHKQMNVSISHSDSLQNTPTDFVPSHFGSRTLHIDDFRVSNQKVSGTAEIATTLEDTAIRVGWHVRLRNVALNVKHWSSEKIANWFRTALDRSTSTKDFHQKLHDLMIEDLRKTFPDVSDPDDLKLELHIPLKLEDRYITDNSPIGEQSPHRLRAA